MATFAMFVIFRSDVSEEHNIYESLQMPKAHKTLVQIYPPNAMYGNSIWTLVVNNGELCMTNIQSWLLIHACYTGLLAIVLHLRVHNTHINPDIKVMVTQV